MAQSVTYLIQLKDRYSTAIKKIASSTSNLERKVLKLQKRLEGASRSFNEIGRTGLKIGAALTAGIGVSLHAWNKQAVAIAQVEQGIKSTGGVAGKN
jgi:hypothetical protein